MNRIVTYLIDMGKLKSIIVFCLCEVAFGMTIIGLGYGDGMEITKDKAIEIANKEVRNFGYDVASMTVKATKLNTPWNEYLPKDSQDEYYVEKKNKLKGKQYWAVYYYDTSYKKGGDVCIFVNSSNGSIITNIRGK